jgi:hypothetical protein
MLTVQVLLEWLPYLEELLRATKHPLGKVAARDTAGR